MFTEVIVLCARVVVRRMLWGSTGGALLLAHGVSATELEWSAPESCSEDAFVQQVEDNLQQGLAEVTLDKIVVTVTEGEPSAWVLEFSLSEEGAERPPSRKLTGASCADVSGAAAVAVAMALHSRAVRERASEPALPAEPAVPSPVPTENVSPNEREPVPPAAEQSGAGASGPSFHWPVQLLLLGDVSLLGTPSYGLGAGVGVTHGRWEAGLSGAVLPSVELRTSDTLGMTLGATIGMAAGCFYVAGPPTTPRVCLGYELGVVYGEGSGTGLSIKREQQALWHALRPEVGLGVPLAPPGSSCGCSRARRLA